MDDPTDEILMAYADGVLDRAEAARIAALLAVRPDLRARLEAFTTTGPALAAPYARMMHEPPPAHLVDLVMGQNRGQSGHAPGAAAGLWSMLSNAFSFKVPVYQTALAFSTVLLIGAGGGWLAATSAPRNSTRGEALVALDGGALVASGGLARALETIPSGRRVALGGVTGTATGGTVHVRLSFKAKDGYCRQYDLTALESGASAGIACRASDGRWRLNVHAANVAGLGTSNKGKPAAGPDEMLRTIVEDIIDGDALSEGDERKLLLDSWRD